MTRWNSTQTRRPLKTHQSIDVAGLRGELASRERRRRLVRQHATTEDDINDVDDEDAMDEEIAEAVEEEIREKLKPCRECDDVVYLLRPRSLPASDTGATGGPVEEAGPPGSGRTSRSSRGAGGVSRQPTLDTGSRGTGGGSGCSRQVTIDWSIHSRLSEHANTVRINRQRTIESSPSRYTEHA